MMIDPIGVLAIIALQPAALRRLDEIILVVVLFALLSLLNLLIGSNLCVVDSFSHRYCVNVLF